MLLVEEKERGRDREIYEVEIQWYKRLTLMFDEVKCRGCADKK